MGISKVCFSIYDHSCALLALFEFKDLQLAAMVEDSLMNALHCSSETTTGTSSTLTSTLTRGPSLMRSWEGE